MIALAFKMGICYDDFLRLNVEDYAETAKSYHEDEENQRRERWNMMRVQTSFSIRPFLSKSVSPSKLIPLWFDNDDEEHNIEAPKSTMSREEQKRRMQLLKETYEK